MKKTKPTLFIIFIAFLIFNSNAQSSGEICLTLTVEQQRQINSYTYLDNSQYICFDNRKELQNHLQ